METNKYEVWMEGYSATGEHEGARKLGTFKGINFKQACVKALNEVGYQMLYTGPQGLGSCYYDSEKNSYWGRRFFDNEEDARKSFR